MRSVPILTWQCPIYNQEKFWGFDFELFKFKPFIDKD